MKLVGGNGGTNQNGGDIILNGGTVGAGGSRGGRTEILENGATYGAFLDASLIAASDKTFTFPNTTGTFALLEAANIFTLHNVFNLTASVSSNFEIGTNRFRFYPAESEDILVNIASTSGTTLFKIASSGHIIFDHDSKPGISACGTGPSNLGNDNVGQITAGTGSPTSCTLTFVKSWAIAPACVANSTSAAMALRVQTTITTMVISGTDLDANTINYICLGHE